MATHLKFEVFDVYDRKESKVSIIRLHVQEQNMPCVYPLADLYKHVSCLLSCPVCVQMCPIGLAQSKVMELIRSPNQSQRLDITFDGGTCGYLHIKAWKVGGAPHPHTLTPSHPHTPHRARTQSQLQRCTSWGRQQRDPAPLSWARLPPPPPPPILRPSPTSLTRLQWTTLSSETFSFLSGVCIETDSQRLTIDNFLGG